MSGETIATCSRDFDGSLSQCLVLMAVRSWSVTLYKVPCWKARNSSKQDRQTKRITGHFKWSKLSICLVQVPFFLLSNMAVLYHVTGHLERTHLNNWITLILHKATCGDLIKVWNSSQAHCCSRSRLVPMRGTTYLSHQCWNSLVSVNFDFTECK